MPPEPMTRMELRAGASLSAIFGLRMLGLTAAEKDDDPPRAAVPGGGCNSTMPRSLTSPSSSSSGSGTVSSMPMAWPGVIPQVTVGAITLAPADADGKILGAPIAVTVGGKEIQGGDVVGGGFYCVRGCQPCCRAVGNRPQLCLLSNPLTD